MNKPCYGVALAALLAGLAGCGPSDDYARRDAEKAVAARLKDPDSAKFSGEFIVKHGINKAGAEDLATCGFVNAKNGFGGYAGATRFVAVQMRSEKQNTFDTYIVALEDSHNARGAPSPSDQPAASLFESVYWNVSCVDATHPATFTGKTS